MAGGPYRILLAEDNPGDVFLLKRALQRAGVECDITAFSDGAAAMSFVKREGEYADAPLPDLAVLDMNLPKRNGSEILEEMRRRPEYAKVPVVMMSSSASPRDQAKASELGGTLYVTKPMDLDGVLKVGEVLKDILLAKNE